MIKDRLKEKLSRGDSLESDSQASACNIGSTVAETDVNCSTVWGGSCDSLINETCFGHNESNGYCLAKNIDGEVGLFYFNARWYDPELGRFITEDPARDGVNWFVYCSNNPLNRTDPTGLEDDEVNKAYIEKLQQSSTFTLDPDQFIDWEHYSPPEPVPDQESYLKVAGDPTGFWTRWAETARSQYKKSDVVPWAGAGILKCQAFIRDLFEAEFKGYLPKIGMKGTANETYQSMISNPNLEQIMGNTPEEILQSAQSYADQGYVVLFSYFNSTSSGHLAALGTSNMAYNTTPAPGSGYSNGMRIGAHPGQGKWKFMRDLAVLVQAGEFVGASPVQLGMNNLADTSLNDNARTTARFYLVRR